VVAESAAEGAQLSAVEYLSAEAERVELVQTMARFHTQFDILLTPTSAYPAPPTHEDRSAPSPVRPSLAAPFSLTRQPALSIPCGVTRDGLPIGLQIVGRHFEDAVVLAVASGYEHFRPFQPPPL
ncbi:MAG: High confidence in function and specificity, partial [Pseudomonadota bacterium]